VSQNSTNQNAAAPVEVSVHALLPGRYQPRRHVSEASLGELADSIREQGVLQPLVVRALARHPEAHAAQSTDEASPDPTADRDRVEAPAYEIVAGERRWRAAKIAGLATVPVIVRDLDDQSALAVALIENLQREDLNPIDQAQSLSRLANEFGLTHEQVARAVGRARASVSNLVRLLDLAEDVKDLLARGAIDMGHARALLPLDARQQVALARKADARQLSVRQVESTVRRLLAEPVMDGGARAEVDLQTRWLQGQLARELGQSVAIRPAADGSYTLQLGFASLSQLKESLQRMQELVEQIRDAAGPRARDPQPE
jgi:ParB family chromosome partitioning protein